MASAEACFESEPLGRGRFFPFTVRTDFVKVTHFTVMVPVTVRVRNRDIRFAKTGGVERGTLNVFGRVTTTSGWVVETFEDTMEVDVPYEICGKLWPMLLPTKG